MFAYGEKVLVAVDGPNFQGSCSEAGFRPDLVGLLKEFEAAGEVEARYYTARTGSDGGRFRKFLNFLDIVGYTTVTKESSFREDEDGRWRLHGNMDVEIALDVVSLAEDYDRLVLFSGDGDFVRVVEDVRATGAKVTVVSDDLRPGGRTSRLLVEACDNFVPLSTLRDRVARSPAEAA